MEGGRVEAASSEIKRYLINLVLLKAQEEGRHSSLGDLECVLPSPALSCHDSTFLVLK